MTLAIEEQVEMMRLLREDEIFREWLKKVPKLGPLPDTVRPWRVWVQRERNGRWGSKYFYAYADAYRYMVKWLRDGAHDATVAGVTQSPPPITGFRKRKYKVKNKVYYERIPVYHFPGVVGQHELHEWCTHCRRPTIFTTFSQHHTFGPTSFDAAARRCAICGIRLTSIRHYR